jgi:hypothetical protein
VSQAWRQNNPCQNHAKSPETEDSMSDFRMHDSQRKSALRNHGILFMAEVK